MTFIIALGVIIVLLCSASVFKLIQPKEKPQQAPQRKKRTHSTSHQRSKTVVKKIKQKPTPQPLNTVISEAQLQEPAVDAFIDKPVEEVNVTPVDVPEIVSLNLMAASDHPYAGYEMLQALLSCGMRFGVMNLFHRHVKKTGAGSILFSLASCTADGSFDLAKIGSFNCKGLVLFMKPHEVDDPVTVFELMLETADQLIHDLGGKVLNAEQKLLKKDDVVALHAQLQQYMQAKKTMDMFE